MHHNIALSWLPALSGLIILATNGEWFLILSHGNLPPNQPNHVGHGLTNVGTSNWNYICPQVLTTRTFLQKPSLCSISCNHFGISQIVTAAAERLRGAPIVPFPCSRTLLVLPCLLILPSCPPTTTTSATALQNSGCDLCCTLIQTPWVGWLMANSQTNGRIVTPPANVS